MFLELIATFAAGIGAAGIVLILNRLTSGRLPGWAMPAGAGLAMLAVTVFMEMSWGARTIRALPQGVAVVETVQDKAWWRPWTYLAPQTVRLVTLDTASVRENPAAPGVRLVDLYLFARWQPPARVPQLVRCDPAGRADPSEAALADPASASWRAAAPALTELACKEAQG